MEEKEYCNLWYELASQPQPTKLIDFPRMKNGKPIGQIIIRTLSHDDHVAIQKAATFECDRSFKEDKIEKNSEIYSKRYDNIVAKHFLFRVCRDPDDVDKPFFPTSDHVGKYISNDEVAMILKHYETLQNEKGPIISYMSGSEFEEWIEKLAQSAEEGPYFLDRILPEAQLQLILYMANQLWNYRMDKSSPTMLPNEPPSEPILEPISQSQVPEVPIMKD